MNIIELEGRYGKAKVFADELEPEAYRILLNYLNHPASQNQKVRLMPDVHAGKGVCIGFTAELNPDFVIPNIVGVDIGCGVLTINIGKSIPSFDEIDAFIRENIPSGRDVHNSTSHLSDVSVNFIRKVIDTAKRTNQDVDYVLCSLGTLGGGNHFIEIGKSEKTGDYWLTIHSGSRNFGLKIANYHQQIAERTCRKELLTYEIEKLKQKYQGKELGEKINELKQQFQFPKELSFLRGDYAKAYLKDMQVAQEYARYNRRLMAYSIIKAFNLPVIDEVESIHNYIDFDDNIIRKGAIRAHRNEKVVVPMNMAYGIVIGIGKGNDDWNRSAPHGAGRKMSRSQAKKELSLDEFKKVMNDAGVFSTSIGEHTIDEAPFVYKEPDKVLSYMKETVDVVDIVKAVYNFKA